MMYTKTIERKDVDLKAPVRSLFPKDIEANIDAGSYDNCCYYRGKPYTIILRGEKDAEYDVAFRLAETETSTEDYLEVGIVEREGEKNGGWRFEDFSAYWLGWLDEPIGKAIEVAEKESAELRSSSEED